MKTLEAVGQIYKGIAILHTMTGFIVYSENGKKFEFETESEAKSFVDAWLIANQRVLIIGDMPVQ